MPIGIERIIDLHEDVFFLDTSHYIYAYLKRICALSLI